MQDKMSINRVAVVTGANKGIGFHVAFQLASSGLFSHIILGCRDATRGQNAVNEIYLRLSESDKEKTEVSYLPLIVGDHLSHETFLKALDSSYGKVDVLVNNAGIFPKGTLSNREHLS